MAHNLWDCITEASEAKTAIGHFNVSDSNQLSAVFRAAKKLGVPVIIGVSEGEREFIGVPQIAALVRAFRDEYDYPLFLNADHSYSFEGVKEAVDAGFDSVIFDGAALSFDENVEETKRAVEYARSVNPDILIEGELGFIGKSSKLLDEIPEGAAITPEMLTTPEDAAHFVEATDVDLLAPAVGNLHGMLKHGKEPALNIDLIAEIRERAGVPLVLHGGSGTSNEDFVAARKAGMAIIHINTEIRLAYRNALKETLEKDSEEIAPYKFLAPARSAVEDKVLERLALFSGRSLS